MAWNLLQMFNLALAKLLKSLVYQVSWSLFSKNIDMSAYYILELLHTLHTKIWSQLFLFCQEPNMTTVLRSWAYVYGSITNKVWLVPLLTWTTYDCYDYIKCCRKKGLPKLLCMYLVLSNIQFRKVFLSFYTTLD